MEPIIDVYYDLSVRFFILGSVSTALTIFVVLGGLWIWKTSKPRGGGG